MKQEDHKCGASLSYIDQALQFCLKNKNKQKFRKKKIHVDGLDDVTSKYQKPSKNLSQYILLSPSSSVLCRAQDFTYLANSQKNVTMVVNLRHTYNHCVCVSMHVCATVCLSVPDSLCECICVSCTYKAQRHSHCSDASNNSLQEVNHSLSIYEKW